MLAAPATSYPRAGTLGLFVLTVSVDVLIDRDLSLFALYLVPTLYAVWFPGFRWGYGSCLASMLVCSLEDWGLSSFYHHTLIPYWNPPRRRKPCGCFWSPSGALSYDRKGRICGATSPRESPAICCAVCIPPGWHFGIGATTRLRRDYPTFNRSIDANRRDWDAAPGYDYFQREREGEKTKTSEVIMLAGIQVLPAGPC